MTYQDIITRWSAKSLKFKTLGGISAFLLITCLFCLISLPNVDELKSVHMQVPLQIYSHDHKLIATFGEKKRFPLTIKQMPLLMQNAFVAAEDQRFYKHHGVDFFGLARATGALIAKRGHITQGASTITMQVARNFFLSRHKTFARKLNEILLAWKIEDALSKRKILELYLNKIYLGAGAYGVAAAGQIYYGKALPHLSLAEMAMLAGLPKAPSANNPLRNPVRAVKRRNYVLYRMLHLGFINQSQYDRASQAAITASYHGPNIQLHAPDIAEMTRQAMLKQYGHAAYTDGFKVITTIDSKTQKYANNALRTGLIHYTERHGFIGPAHENIDLAAWPEQSKSMPTTEGFTKALVQTVDDQKAIALLDDSQTNVTIPWSEMQWASKRLANDYRGKPPQSPQDILKPGDAIYLRKMRHQWHLTQIPVAQAALVSLNANDGSILALVGGFDYSLSHYNRVLQAKRQSGSAFKPFIYAAALNNHMTLANIINDAPIVINDVSSTTPWRPHNSSDQFRGPTRLREGLTKSSNLVSIRLLQEIGITNAVHFIQRFQFSPEALPESLSLALGSGINTPMEITRGYAVFANGGFLIQPSFIHTIKGANDQLLYQASPAKACDHCQHPAPSILDPGLAYLVHNVLQDVIQHGTGRSAKSLKRTDLAGKTGTTNNKIDAWFSGFNRDIVTTVWLGFDNPRSLHEYGAQAALPIWTEYMGKTLGKSPNHTLARPNDIITIRINPKTGKPASARQQETIFEIFRQTSLPLNNTTG